MANQNDLFYRPDIPAPEKDTDLSGFTSKTDKAAIDAIAKLNAALSENDVADELIYKSINELAEEVYGTSKTSAIDALIAQFATHEKNAEIVRERLLFLIDIMIEDMNADLANAPAIVKQYVTDLTGIVIADDVTTLDAETIKCILVTAGITDPAAKAKLLNLDDDSSSAMDKVTESLSNISKMNIAQFGLMLLIIVLKLCYVICIHYTVGFLCAFFKDKLKFKVMKVSLRIGKSISSVFKSAEKKLLGLPFIGYKCSRDDAEVPICNSNSDPSQVKINVVTCCTMNPIFFDSTQANTNGGVNSCFKAWIDAQMNPDTAGVRGPICGGSCKHLIAGTGDLSQNTSMNDIPAESTAEEILGVAFAGLSKPELEATLESFEEEYARISDERDALTLAYQEKIRVPDPALPTTADDKTRAEYESKCAETRAKWKEEYDSRYKELSMSLMTSDNGASTLSDSIDYLSDLLYTSPDSPLSDKSEDTSSDGLATVTAASCAPTATEQMKAGVISDYLIANAKSKSGVTDPANISLCSQGIAKTDAATAMSQQVQSSLNSAKANTYTGNPNGLGDCFGYSTDSNYAKYRNMSKSDRENAMTADLQKLISEQAQKLEAADTDSGTAIASGEIFGYDGSGSLTDILGVADQATTSLIGAADNVVTKVAGMSRWLSSMQLCCVIYIMVFIVSIARVIMKGDDYTLCREKCDTCNGTGSVTDTNGKSSTCPACKGSGYKKDLMDSATWVRKFMHVQWAKSAGGSGNIKALVALLTIIKQIVDIFSNKNKRNLLLSGLTLPINEMFQLIKTVIAAALTEFLDALFGPLDLALSSALGIPEIRNMMNNECPILPPIIKWLQCMLNGMKFGIVTSFMKLFDANIQDIVVISDILLCRQRMLFLDALSKLLGDLLNLIQGLKDCYDPEALVDYIIEDVKEDGYTKYTQLLSLLKTQSRVDMFNACVNGSVANNTVTFSDAEIAEIMSNPGNNNSGFTPELAAIIDKFNSEQDISPLKVKYTAGVAKLVPESSQPDASEASIVIPTYGEFKQELEDVTGVTMSAVKESMNEIYAILSGDTRKRS